MLPSNVAYSAVKDRTVRDSPASLMINHLVGGDSILMQKLDFDGYCNDK